MTEEAGVRLLLVEDEVHLATGLKLNFELEGYAVALARTAREARELLATTPAFDAIVLDVMLPDADGFELCASLRESGDFTPVLMLTARNTVQDRVSGLQVGADDYLTKPFELSELTARLRSLLRRRTWERKRGREHEPHALRFGEASVNFGTATAECRGQELRLTKLEFDLLRYFSENPNRVLSRDELQEKVWRLHNYSNTRMVDNFIMRLRKHFEPDPAKPRYFVSVRGSGYKYVPNGDDDPPTGDPR